MKIQNLKTKVIGPVLLLIPMACMHIGDGHHSGDHHSSTSQPSYQSSIYCKVAQEIQYFSPRNRGFTLFTCRSNFNIV
jgi:hypothetical protein